LSRAKRSSHEGARPVGIDLFAGAGGMSLGFEQAGFDVAAAVEIDPVHAAVHHYNFPHCTVVPESVLSLTGAELRRRAGIAGAVDVVFGGAPCQGFSLMGYRSIDDPRNRLVKEFVRLVAELEPKYFVFENVKGLTTGRHRPFLAELLAEFAAIAYEVVSPWQILNAAEFGVPQQRDRLFLIGARQGMPLPDYPSPQTIPAGTTVRFSTAGLPVGPSCREALGDLPEAEHFEELRATDRVRVDAWGARSPYASALRCETDADWHYGYRRRWEPLVLTASWRTKHTEVSRQRFAEARPGRAEPISRFFKLPADGISNTLRAGTDSARGAFTSPRPIHYARPRCVTVREMARLHGFPDWFRPHATKWHGARQIGNSVPPPLARAIAAQLLQALEQDPLPPTAELALGDESLLYLDMSQAARRWGVPVAIAQRNLKGKLRPGRTSEAIAPGSESPCPERTGRSRADWSG